MPAKPTTGSVRSIYEFMKAHHQEFATEAMFRASFTASLGVYGATRVFLDLREAGETWSKHRVERLVRENGVRALQGYRTRRHSHLGGLSNEQFKAAHVSARRGAH